MDFTGRPMKGYVFVAPGGLRGDDALAGWIERGRTFVAESVLGSPSPKRRAAARPRVRGVRASPSSGRRSGG